MHTKVININKKQINKWITPWRVATVCRRIDQCKFLWEVVLEVVMRSCGDISECDVCVPPVIIDQCKLLWEVVLEVVML